MLIYLCKSIIYFIAINAALKCNLANALSGSLLATANQLSRQSCVSADTCHALALLYKKQVCTYI